MNVCLLKHSSDNNKNLSLCHQVSQWTETGPLLLLHQHRRHSRRRPLKWRRRGKNLIIRAFSGFYLILCNVIIPVNMNTDPTPSSPLPTLIYHLLVFTRPPPNQRPTDVRRGLLTERRQFLVVDFVCFITGTSRRVDSIPIPPFVLPAS